MVRKRFWFCLFTKGSYDYDDKGHHIRTWTRMNIFVRHLWEGLSNRDNLLGIALIDIDRSVINLHEINHYGRLNAAVIIEKSIQRNLCSHPATDSYGTSTTKPSFFQFWKKYSTKPKKGFDFVSILESLFRFRMAPMFFSVCVNWCVYSIP